MQALHPLVPDLVGRTCLSCLEHQLMDRTRRPDLELALAKLLLAFFEHGDPVFRKSRRGEHGEIGFNDARLVELDELLGTLLTRFPYSDPCKGDAFESGTGGAQSTIPVSVQRHKVYSG